MLLCSALSPPMDRPRLCGMGNASALLADPMPSNAATEIANGPKNVRFFILNTYREQAAWSRPPLLRPGTLDLAE